MDKNKVVKSQFYVIYVSIYLSINIVLCISGLKKDDILINPVGGRWEGGRGSLCLRGYIDKISALIQF